MILTKEQRYDLSKKKARLFLQGMEYEEMRAFVFSILTTSPQRESYYGRWDDFCDIRGKGELVGIVDEYFNREVQ